MEVALNHEEPDILVVDDDPNLCAILVETIAIYLPRAKVELASNASEAIACLAKQHFDLLISDNIMPGTDGIDMIADLQDQYPNLKIVMMTAFKPVSLRKRLDEMGEIHLLEKPFGLADLIEALEPDF